MGKFCRKRTNSGRECVHTHRYTQLCVHTQSVPVLLSTHQVLGQRHLLLFVALLAQSICPFPRKAAGRHLSVIWEQKKSLGHFWSPEPRAQATFTTSTSHSPYLMGKVLCPGGTPSSGPQFLSCRRCACVYTHKHTHTHLCACPCPDRLWLWI